MDELDHDGGLWLGRSGRSALYLEGAYPLFDSVERELQCRDGVVFSQFCEQAAELLGQPCFVHALAPEGLVNCVAAMGSAPLLPALRLFRGLA